MKITQLSEDDKKFLEEFENLETLAMNNTGIKSLSNLPNAPSLGRVSSRHYIGLCGRNKKKIILVCAILFIGA